MKKLYLSLKRRIESYFWNSPYIRFRLDGDVVKSEFYWPKDYFNLDRTPDENFLNVFRMLQQHPAFTEVVRQSVLKYGLSINEPLTSMYILNIIDGLDKTDAIQMALAGMYNEKAPQQVSEQERVRVVDMDDPEDIKGDTFLDPALYYVYHAAKKSL